MTMAITAVPLDSGPLWKIPLARCRVDTCSPESLDSAPRKTRYKNCLSEHSSKPHPQAMGLLSTGIQWPPQDAIGSPDPLAPSQDTHSAP